LCTACTVRAAQAEETGYTRDGRIVASDTQGLSAYLEWLKGHVLHAPRFKEEWDELPSEQRAKLAHAVRDGEALLSEAWKRPKSAKKVTARRKREIDALLASVVTREEASDALYTACFPDRKLTEAFKALLRHREARAHAVETSTPDKPPEPPSPPEPPQQPQKRSPSPELPPELQMAW
jgi:hypothetical protein